MLDLLPTRNVSSAFIRWAYRYIFLIAYPFLSKVMIAAVKQANMTIWVEDTEMPPDIV